MRPDIRLRQQSAMAEFGLSALVAFSTDNVAYGAGYQVPSQKLAMRHRHFAVVCTRDGRSAMMLTSNEVDEARDRTEIEDLYGYNEFTEDPVAVLCDILDDLGVADELIGIEVDALPVTLWLRLQELRPRLRWAPAADAFSRARMIKTSTEIDLLRQSADIAVAAQVDAYRAIRPGMTERDAFRLITDNALTRGADDIVMIQVAAGKRSTFSNPTPGDTPFRTGELVKFDVFVSKSGYLSDTGRSVAIAEASTLQRDTWSRMNDVFDLIRDAVRPGVATAELWSIFTREFAARQMTPAMTFLGHGLGLSLHEEPYIAAHTSTTLEPGMVFAIEPVFARPDEGYHLEDILLVTDDGYENLTPQFARDLTVCGGNGSGVPG